MSRKEASNTWHDGLVMDLNPLNTPNSVLTDNLNGTIITYNGNEHLLQNDMGNYKLKNCRLSENFVPVGLKEYGDILYIVSYNPITEETEVGSYPSPAQINSATPLTVKDEGRQSVILKTKQHHPNLRYLDTDEYNYSVVFADEKMKLHPGDKYDLQRTTSKDYPKYEGNDYYILDEDNIFHDITDFVERDLNDRGYKFVPWDVPGWMCIKSKVFNFDKYTMSITRFDKANDNLTIGIRSKFYINDPIFTKEYAKYLKSPDILQQLMEDLSIKLNIYIDNNSKVDTKLTTTSEGTTVLGWDWYDDGVIVQFDYTKDLTANFTNNSMIKIISTPILSEGDRYSITYSHLEQTIESNVDNIIKATAGSIKCSGTYKFYRDNEFEDERGVGSVLKFNIDLEAIGEEILVADDDFKLYLTLFDLNGNRIRSVMLDSDIEIGENGKPVQNEFEFVLLPEQREEIYYLTITSRDINNNYDSISEETEFVKFGNDVRTIVVTSTVFENYMEEDITDFTNIPMKTWVTDYLNTIFDEATITISDITYKKMDSWTEGDKNSVFWQTFKKSNGSDLTYSDCVTTSNGTTSVNYLPGFVKDGVNISSSEVLSGIDYRCNFEITENTIYKNFESKVVGIWKHLIPSKLKYVIVDLNSDEELECIEKAVSYGDNETGDWDENYAVISGNTVIFDASCHQKISSNVSKDSDYIYFAPYSKTPFLTKFPYNQNQGAIQLLYDTNLQMNVNVGSLKSDETAYNGSKYAADMKFDSDKTGVSVWLSPNSISFSKPVNYIKFFIQKDRYYDNLYLQYSDGTRLLAAEDKGTYYTYFTALRTSSGKYAFIWCNDKSSISGMTKEFSDSYWVESSYTPEKYYQCLVDDTVEIIESNPDISIEFKCILETLDKWTYNGVDLLAISDNPSILTMSDWSAYTVESSIGQTIEGVANFDDVISKIQSQNNDANSLTQSVAKAVMVDSTKINYDSSNFLGFYPGTTQFARNLEGELQYNSGNLTCNYDSSKLLQIYYDDSGSKNYLKINLGYYI